MQRLCAQTCVSGTAWKLCAPPFVLNVVGAFCVEMACKLWLAMRSALSLVKYVRGPLQLASELQVSQIRNVRYELFHLRSLHFQNRQEAYNRNIVCMPLR